MMIREADKKDADVLKELWIKSFKNEKQLNKNIDLRSEIKGFKKDFPKLFKENKYFLAEEGGRILGFIGGKIKIGSGFFKNKRIGIIHALFVDEEYRNMGIGAKITELSVSSNNTLAINLYNSLGFKEFIIKMRKKI